MKTTGNFTFTNQGLKKTLLLFTTASFLSFSMSYAENGPKEKTIRPVKLVKITKADSRVSRKFPSIIQASKSTKLSFQVSGKLQELKVKKSQKVKKGAILAILDPTDFKKQVQLIRTQTESSEKEFLRASRLFEKDAISKSQYEQRKSKYDLDQLQLEVAEKALEDSVLYAPFSGVVSDTIPSSFEMVQAGQGVLNMYFEGELEATVDVPASYIAQVPTRNERKAFVFLEANPGQKIEATFKSAKLEADASSQTYAVTFSFTPPKDMVILPGMNATMELSYTEAKGNKDALSVPLASVHYDGESNYVWLFDTEKQTVAKRVVEVADGIGENLSIIKGLASGDSIVGAGGAYMAEGMKVRPWNPSK